MSEESSNNRSSEYSPRGLLNRLLAYFVAGAVLTIVAVFVYPHVILAIGFVAVLILAALFYPDALLEFFVSIGPFVVGSIAFALVVGLALLIIGFVATKLSRAGLIEGVPDVD